MANKNNVAILSLMAKIDEKSIKESAAKYGKTAQEAMSDVSSNMSETFGKEMADAFKKALEIATGKLKGVNLSSYTGNILDSLFSDKDITEKTKDLETFIKNMTNLSKSLSGLNPKSLNSMNTKQLDTVIKKQEDILAKEQEIADKRTSLEKTANNIASKKNKIGTISKNYLSSDYEKTNEELKKIFATENEFDETQKKSIKHLSEMLALYSDMEKMQPQKGTSEAIKYSTNLLTVVREIKKTSGEIDLFTGGKATKYVTDNFSSIEKVTPYNINLSKQNYVEEELKKLNSQKAKIEKDLANYIVDIVQKNLQKTSNEMEAVVDKATQKVEKLQSKMDDLKGNTSSQKPLVGEVVDESQLKSLDEIKNRLKEIYDKDADARATQKELKEFILLYKQYEQLVSKNDINEDFKNQYDYIVKNSKAMREYADSIQIATAEQEKVDVVTEPDNSDSSKRIEQLRGEERQADKTTTAEKELSETHDGSIETIKRDLKEVQESITDLSNRVVDLENSNFSSGLSEQINTVTESVSVLKDKLQTVYELVDKFNDKSLNWSELQFHQGNLEDIKNTKSRDNFGDMINGLLYGGYLERGYGYGSGGTGLYTAQNIDEFQNFVKKPNGTQSYFGYAIDWSKYPDAFKPESVESAKKLHEFLSNLQAFCIKLGSGFEGFDEKLGDIDTAKLYSDYQSIFKNARMDFTEFSNFINEMSDLIKSAGSVDEDQFSSISEELSTSENISTRFMRKNGYSGINVSGLKGFDNVDIGSVLYDIRDGAIVKRFESLSDLENFVNRQTEEINRIAKTNKDRGSLNLNEIELRISEIKDEIVELNRIKEQLLNEINDIKSSNNTSNIFQKIKNGDINTVESLINEKSGLTNVRAVTTGFSHSNNSFISDEITVLGRSTDYEAKIQSLIPLLEKVETLGVNVGTIIGTVKDDSNNLIYEIQKTQKGKIINSSNLEFLKATDEQLQKLLSDLQILKENGLYLDFDGDNILYDKEKGFSFIDLATKKSNYTVSGNDIFEKYFKKILSPDIYESFISKLFPSLEKEILTKGETNISSTSTETIVEENSALQQQETQIGEVNEGLEQEKSLLDQLIERIEKIRMLGVVGGGKSEEEILKNYGQESTDHKALRMQLDGLKTLTPSGKVNPDIRDMVFNPEIPTEEVAKKLLDAAQCYQDCKNALDKLFADNNIVGGKVYNDAYRFLDLFSDDALQMASVVGETREKLTVMRSGQPNISSENLEVKSLEELIQLYHELGTTTGTENELSKISDAILNIVQAEKQLDASEMQTLVNVLKGLTFTHGDSPILKTPYSVDQATTILGNLSSAIEEQNKLQEELRETEVQAGQTAQAVREVTSQDQMKDAFQGENGSGNAPKIKENLDETIQDEVKAEAQAIEQEEKVIEETTEAKKEFSMANEEVQSSINDSKSPLEVEAELMDQIAKSAREAADAKKEFVEANKQVANSANESNSDLETGHSENAEPTGVKKYKKKGYKARNKGSRDNEIKVSGGKTLEQALRESQEKVASGLNSNVEVIKEITDFYDSNDNLVKTQMKVINAETKRQSTYTTSYSVDKDGNATAWTSHIDTNKIADREKQEAKEIQVEWDKNVAAIQEYMNAVTKLNNLKTKDKGTGKNSKEIEVQTQKVEELKQVAYEAKANLTSMIDPHNADLGDWSKWVEAMKQLGQASQGSAESVAKLEDALRNVKTSTLDSVQSTIDVYEQKVKDFSNIPVGFDQSTTYKNNIKSLTSAINVLKTYKAQLATQDTISNNDLNQIKKYEQNVENATRAIMSMTAAEKGSTSLGRDKLYNKIGDYLKKNSGMSNQFKKDLKDLQNQLKSLGGDANVNKLTDEFVKLQSRIREAGEEGKKFWDVIKEKAWYGMASQIGMYFGFNDIIRYIQQGIQVVTELDTAFTEMRKVSDETTQSLKNYQETTFDVADAVGTTAAQIQNSTADFMRLGESMDEAAESARVANILMNVSEFESIDDATSSLTSMAQAYQDLDKMTIVDKLNEVGKIIAQTYSNIWCYKNIAW